MTGRSRGLFNKKGRQYACFSCLFVCALWYSPFELLSALGKTRGAFLGLRASYHTEESISGAKGDLYSAALQQHDDFSQDFRFQRLHGELADKLKEKFVSKVDGPARKAAGLSWYRYTNICINGEDEYRYFSGNNNTFEADLARLGLKSNITPPYQSSPFSWEDFLPKDTESFYLTGTTVILGCWRIKRDRPQPSHYMFGYGKLYALLNDENKPFHINHVIFHQCPDKRLGDFFNSVWQITYESGMRLGWFNSSTRFYTIGKDNVAPVFCVQRGLVDHSTGFSLGTNHNITVRAWRKDVNRFLLSQSRVEHSNYPSLVSHTRGYGSHSSCGQQLKIGVFQRREGTNLRLFDNLNDVLLLLKSFSEFVEVFTISSNSSFFEAATLFNKYDIIITPHGSHLTNGILIDFQTRKPMIIELVATCINADFMKNLGRHFATYEINTGHLITNPEDREYTSGCHGFHVRQCSYTPTCTFGHVRTALQDIVVNITLLRDSVSEAISRSCEF